MSAQPPADNFSRIDFPLEAHHPFRMSTTYGERLKMQRESKGLTQEGLAQKAGTTVTTVATHERGEVPSPRTEMVRKLADALDVPISELLEGEPKRPAATEPPIPKATLAYLEANPGLTPDEVAYVKRLWFGDGKPKDSTFGIALAAYRDSLRGVAPPARATALPEGVKRRVKKRATR
jgi:transcriptional regulator with XRE-family HTH domain